MVAHYQLGEVAGLRLPLLATEVFLRRRMVSRGVRGCAVRVKVRDV